MIELVPAGDVLDVESEITATAMFSYQSHAFAFVATSDYNLILCNITKGVLRECARISLDGSIAQSIQVLCKTLRSMRGDMYYVLWGTRDGRLASVELQLSTDVDDMAVTSDNMTINKPDFKDIEYNRMGHGPVQVSLDVNSTQRALILCDNETVVVEIADQETSNLHFTSVYFTDENNTSFRQSPLAAVVVLPSSHEDDNTEDNDTGLACHDGQNLIVARLLYERKTIPRRLPLKKHQPFPEMDIPPKDISGTPTRLLYSDKLDSTIVAGAKYEHRPKGKVPEPAWQGKRVTRGFLSVIPSAANRDLSPNQESWNEKATQIDFAPSERVLSVCEWSFEREGRRYHYLLVGTSIHKGEIAMIQGRRQRVKKGRLWFLAPRKNGDGTIKLDLKSIKDVNRPVRALAVLDDQKVVVALEGMVSIYTFSAENK
jgi:hypothetical protein